MGKLVRKWPFTAPMVADAPDHAGLFALWRGERLVMLGRADGGADTIRARLQAHLAGAHARGPAAPTHYSWEICADPRGREAAVRAALAQAA